jgi:PhoH-like ATPase
MALKNFVLDTNVLIHFPKAIYEFEDNRVIIPIKVIEELDRIKSYHDERSRNAREAARELDKFRGSGNLQTGAPLPDGGIIQVVFPPEGRNIPGLKGSNGDNDILLTIMSIIEEQAKKPKRAQEKVIFVSKDLNARIKGDALGIETQDFEKQKVSIDDLYSGHAEVVIPGALVDRFYKEGHLDYEDPGWCPNQFVMLADENNRSHTALARWNGRMRRFLPLEWAEKDVWGVKALNREQRFALECLMDDSIALVALVGQAGTGKTLIALAAGLAKVADERRYKRLIVSRPIVPLGRDLGYLPGTKDEKLRFWMEPVFDNLEFILSQSPDTTDRSSEESIRYLIERGILELEALTYIRGRSISRQYFVVDEAQNLTPQEIKTIISRAGEGTKIVLTGDPYQIDNVYLDANSNGLCYAVDKLKDSPLFATVTLTKSERSELASLAALTL